MSILDKWVYGIVKSTIQKKIWFFSLNMCMRAVERWPRALHAQEMLWEIAFGGWESNLEPLEKQEVCVTAELSFQPSKSPFNINSAVALHR